MIIVAVRIVVFLEVELQREDELALVPVGEELALALVDFLIRHFEPNSLIRVRRKQDVLVFFVRSFDVLLISGHETVTWLESLLDLGVAHLEQKASLACFWISLLRDFVSRTPNFDGLFTSHSRPCQWLGQ